LFNKGYNIYHNSKGPSRGVAILLSSKCKFEVLEEGRDLDDNILILKLKMGRKIFTVGSIYGPNTNQGVHFFEELKQKVNSMNCNNIILGGDWNCTFDNRGIADNIDVINMVNIPSKIRTEHLLRVCNSLGVTDPYRTLWPVRRDYTYVPAIEGNLNRSRLDFFLVSHNLIPTVGNCTINNALLTKAFDHKEISISFKYKVHKNKNMSIMNSLVGQPEIEIAVKAAAYECFFHHIDYTLYPMPRNELLMQIGLVYESLDQYMSMKKEHNNNLDDLNLAMGVDRQKEIMEGRLRALPPYTEVAGSRLTCSEEFFFEALCSMVRNSALKYQKKIYSNEIEWETQILGEINVLKEDFIVNQNDIFELEHRLVNLRENRIKREVENYKISELLNSEKMTPQFLNLLKCTKGEDSLSVVKDGNGEVFDNKVAQEEYIRSEYEKIYKKPINRALDDDCIEKFLEEVNTIEEVNNTKLTVQERQNLEQDLTLDELDKAVRKVKVKSAPGADGYSNKFIKHHWDTFRVPLFRLANFFYAENRLSDSFRSADIKLIPKKGNITELKNWRPISLLNCFYKIISRVFTNRIRTVIDKITKVGQKGHSKNKRCQEVLITLIEGITECKIKNKRGAILSVDIKKAFDCIAHDFVEKALHYYNFGPNMIKWVLLLSTGRRACLLLDNGRKTNFFNLLRGNAQGDVISPFIFNICFQILLNKINFDLQINPVLDSVAVEFDLSEERIASGHRSQQVVSTNKVKVLAMADDATFIVKMEHNTLRRIKDILAEYGTLTWLECNIEKTVLIPIGDTTNIDPRIVDLGFSITNKTVIVGMEISNDLGHFENVITNIQNKIRREINYYRRFNLSLPGRVNIAKTMLYSQINYLGCFLPFDSRQCTAIENIIGEFVSGNLKIARKRWVMDRDKGGLGLFNVEDYLDAQRCNWFKLLQEGENCDEQWKRTLKISSNGILRNLRCSWVNKFNRPICYGIAKSFAKFRDKLVVYKLNYWEGLVYCNSNIRTPTRPSREFDDAFFNEFITNERERKIIESLCVRNFFSNGEIIGGEIFRYQTGLQLTDEKLSTITRVLLRIKVHQETNFAGETSTLTVRDILLNKNYKGAFFRKILTFNNIIENPHNIVKYAGTSESVITLEQGKDLNSLWGFNFLDTGVRTFVFKLHNNSIGTNLRVSKFVRGHSPICTFCALTENPDDKQESILHLFFQCRTVEPLIMEYYSNILGNEEFEVMQRKNFFGGFNRGEKSTKTVLLFINLWFKYYIWMCRLRKCIPTLGGVRNYIKTKVHLTSKISKKWKMWLNSAELNKEYLLG